MLDKKELEYIVTLLSDRLTLLDKTGNQPELFAQNLIIYLKSIISAPDKPSWTSNVDSHAIAKLLNDDSNL